MKNDYPILTGWVLFLVLTLIFIIHIYWGAGGFWPGDSLESLSSIVLGGQQGEVIPVGLETYLISTVFLLFALLAISPFTTLKKLLPDRFHKVLFYLVAAVFLIRAGLGFLEQWIRPSPEGTPFIFWNRVLYSPLCLFMGSGYAYIVRSVYGK